jgi:hypothetical protein
MRNSSHALAMEKWEEIALGHTYARTKQVD